MDERLCKVWIAGLAKLRPSHDALLDHVERSRAAAFARPADRSRFVAGAVLLKLAAADAMGLAPAQVTVDRRCDQCGAQHGRPRIADSGFHVSVGHSGSLAAAALTRAGPVGIDLEERGAPLDPALNLRVLAPSEHVDSAEQFLRYWCRKESAVKATGEGLRAPLQDVIVTPPDRLAALISYRGQPLPAVMADLDVGDPGYAAALTVLTETQICLDVAGADRLMGA